MAFRIHVRRVGTRPHRALLAALGSILAFGWHDDLAHASSWPPKEPPSNPPGCFAPPPAPSKPRMPKPCAFQTGVASWYGSEHQGRPTANGEIFDMNGLTAAHPSLPMNALVRVTHLASGRAIIVRINDRGPFARGRIIDLTAKAAELLGFKDRGLARVRLEVLPVGGA